MSLLFRYNARTRPSSSAEMPDTCSISARDLNYFRYGVKKPGMSPPYPKKYIMSSECALYGYGISDIALSKLCKQLQVPKSPTRPADFAVTAGTPDCEIPTV